MDLSLRKMVVIAATAALMGCGGGDAAEEDTAADDDMAPASATNGDEVEAEASCGGAGAEGSCGDATGADDPATEDESSE